MSEQKPKTYCTALELAKYVNYKHFEKTREDISPLKLQKSLYFLFAYWGGFVRKSKKSKEADFNSEYEWLFDDTIEAWVYGPVIPSVYTYFKDAPINQDKIELEKIIKTIERDPQIKEFLSGLLEELFEISAFKLVDIAHEDECWKNNYNDNANKHNKEISKEDIIVEYSKK